jgi:superoxide reductase
MHHAEWIKAPGDEGKEKHVPVIIVEQGFVRVVVGHTVPHPNTDKHYIQWLELYGEKKDTKQVVYLGRAEFTPIHSEPNVPFKVNTIGDFAKFHALSYCNLHGVWANSLVV